MLQALYDVIYFTTPICVGCILTVRGGRFASDRKMSPLTPSRLSHYTRSELGVSVCLTKHELEFALSISI